MYPVSRLHAQKALDSEKDQSQSCHSKPVLESHLVLLRTCEFSDVTFIVGKSKERIPCHQLFLKARSPVFKVMFSERWNQGRKDIPLEDVDPKIFLKFLEFIYADNFVASVPEALALLQVAHKYDVQLLVSKCEQVLVDNPVMLDDAVDVFQMARKYGMLQLMNQIGDLMAKSISHLQFLPSFSRMDKQTLTYLLQRDDLKMKEVDLFRLAVKWAKNQYGSVVEQSLMEDILPLIRFPLMSLEEFTNVVLPSGLLSQCAVIEVFTYFGTDAETRRALADTISFSTQQRAVDNGKNKVWGLPFVSFYSADFANCRSRQEKYVLLLERLKFDIGEIVDGAGGLFSRKLLESSLVTSDEAKKKNVVLSSIRLYCPTEVPGISSGIASSLTKRFHVAVTSHNAKTAKYLEIRCVQPDVEIEEGQMTEVKLEREVPVEKGKSYGIIVRESGRGMHCDLGEGQTYEAKDFGDIQDNIAMTIGDTSVLFQNVRRIPYLCGFDDNSPRPQPNLIYELGLKECCE